MGVISTLKGFLGDESDGEGEGASYECRGCGNTFVMPKEVCPSCGDERIVAVE